MGTWVVDSKTEPGILRLALRGVLTEPEMAAFVQEHNRAIDGFGGRDYKVWCDVSELKPLTQECAALFETAKQYSSAHPNFRGSAVLASSAMVAMQHRRTSIQGGVMGTELISDDVNALQAHLRRVYRRTR